MTKHVKGKNVETVGVHVYKPLLERVKQIMNVKYPLREVHYSVEIVREALLDYVEMNKGFIENP